VEDSLVIRTFTTRLQATLTAVGLLVAIGAQPAKAQQQPMPLPQNRPVQAYPPTITAPARTTNPPAAAPVTIMGPGAAPVTITGPAPDVVIGAPTPAAPAPGCGCATGTAAPAMVPEGVIGGGMGYLMSSGCGAFGGCVSPLEYWKFDYMHLRRDVDNPFTLITAQLPTGEIFNTRVGRDDFDADPAVRVTYGRALIESSACDLFLEVTYFGMHHANTSGFTVGGPGVALFGSQFGPLFDATNAQTYSYVSDLHSLEVNLKTDYYLDNTLYYLLGLRYIRFDDRLKVRETGQLAVMPAFLPQAFRTTKVTNNLVGGQIGFDWQTRDLTSRWNLGAYGRGGIYANMTDGEIRQGANASNQGVFNHEVDPGRFQGSAVLEGGFVSTYAIRPNFLFRAGYHVTWLGAIALAPDQGVPDLQTGEFNGRLSTNEDVFFHGPFLGFEINWGCCR
jgi:hypothetical protein